MPFAHIAGNTMKGKLLTHGGRVTHICVSKLTIIGSDNGLSPANGLSPSRCRAIIWTNAELLLIRPWGTNFNAFECVWKCHLQNGVHFVSASMCQNFEWQCHCSFFLYTYHHRTLTWDPDIWSLPILVEMRLLSETGYEMVSQGR